MRPNVDRKVNYPKAVRYKPWAASPKAAHLQGHSRIIKPTRRLPMGLRSTRNNFTAPWIPATPHLRVSSSITPSRVILAGGLQIHCTDTPPKNQIQSKYQMPGPGTSQVSTREMLRINLKTRRNNGRKD